MSQKLLSAGCVRMTLFDALLHALEPGVSQRYFPFQTACVVELELAHAFHARLRGIGQGSLNPRGPAAVQPQPRYSTLLPRQHAERRVGPARHEIDILSIQLDENDVAV